MEEEECTIKVLVVPAVALHLLLLSLDDVATTSETIVSSSSLGLIVGSQILSILTYCALIATVVVVIAPAQRQLPCLCLHVHVRRTKELWQTWCV